MTWFRTAEGENGNPRASGRGAGAGGGLGSAGGARTHGRYSQCQGSEGTVRAKPKRLALLASHL
ncbi:hypothetical protein ATI61_10628 [Archangium gephyra]|uniref:Uncharacterized protein n=1 Tax=Archangium gephyra TaxID=48 RepID=A0ABX9JZK9_9BACT|nr:hypothetical protein ATI61_10628 [Archangium gephyra]